MTAVDIFNYFSQFDNIELVEIKSKEGYGFLLFKSKLGPIKVLEAGDIHRIKGTKIECRKVLDREAMRQQMPEVQIQPQQARAQFATPSPKLPQNPMAMGNWNYDKSNRTSALDTTINTEAGYQNNITPMKRSLRNTGQTFEMPGNHPPRTDDSFLSTQTHGWNGLPGDVFPPRQDWSKQQVPAMETPAHIEPSNPPVATSPPVQQTANPMLSFLDEEDDEPWPENSTQRLTLMPRNLEDLENDDVANETEELPEPEKIANPQVDDHKADEEIANLVKKVEISASDHGLG